MKILRFSHQFKKDFKRYRNNSLKVTGLNNILSILKSGNPARKYLTNIIHIRCLYNIKGVWNATSVLTILLFGAMSSLI